VAVVIRHQIQEQLADGSWVLVLEHQFFGRTMEDAQAILTSHMQADAFLRACSSSGVFAGRHGQVTCRSNVWAENVADALIAPQR
jgi:hypothetical protein